VEPDHHNGVARRDLVDDPLLGRSLLLVDRWRHLFDGIDDHGHHPDHLLTVASVR
jgi:hypothetical protein